LQELAEADRPNKPHSNKPPNNHRHSQLLMEVVEVVVEVVDAVEAVEADQHLQHQLMNQ